MIRTMPISTTKKNMSTRAVVSMPFMLIAVFTAMKMRIQTQPGICGMRLWHQLPTKMYSRLGTKT